LWYAVFGRDAINEIMATTLRALLLISSVVVSQGNVGRIHPLVLGAETASAARQADFVLAEIRPANAPPVLDVLTPSGVYMGASGVVRVIGQGFVAGSTVLLDGAEQETTFGGATLLTIPSPGMEETAGVHRVSVRVPGPGGGVSNEKELIVYNPVPMIDQMFMPQYGAVPAKMTVLGSKFVAGSVVRWNGESRPTTYLQASELEAVLTSEDTKVVGAVTVWNPGPGGGTSAPVYGVARFPDYNGRPPSISSVADALGIAKTAIAGSAGIALTVRGGRFIPVTEVFWNGKPLPLRLLTGDQVEIQFRASDLDRAVAGEIVIRDPTTGLTSNPWPFATVMNLQLHDVVFDPHSGLIYGVTRVGTGEQSTLLGIDPGTSTVVSQSLLPGSAGPLAISDDGQYLYMGTPEQQRIHQIRLPLGTLERSFSLPSTRANWSNLNIAIQPGHSGTIVVGAPEWTAVIDDGQARPVTLSTNIGDLAFMGEDTVYGCAEGWLSRAKLTPAGVNLEVRVPLLCPDSVGGDFFSQLVSDGRRLYTRGMVIDAEAETIVAQLQDGSTIADDRRIIGPKAWVGIHLTTVGLAVYDKEEFGLRDALVVTADTSKLIKLRKNRIAILGHLGTLTFAEIPPWPELQPEGVVSLASGLGGAVSPGEIVSLYGEALSAGDEAPAELQADNRFASELLGVRVLFDGVPAPLMYVGPNQVNAVVPYSVAERGATQIKVTRDGKRSAVVSLPVVPARPAILTLTGTGRGQGAVLNQDMTVNGPGNAAARGSIVALWATGAGQMSPSGEDGLLVTADYPKPILPVTAKISGIEAEILYAGAAPYLVSGALQVNIRVPKGVPPGSEVPIEIAVGGAPSQPGVVVAVE
jgi:uncharacterized protein (TIGR03437 family)